MLYIIGFLPRIAIFIFRYLNGILLSMRPYKLAVVCLVVSIFFMSGFFLFSTTTVSAHGTGKSIERVMGDYLVDIGYDPDPLRAGENSVFDFVLKSGVDKKEIPFTHVWVRLETGSGIVLAAGLKKAELGKTSLLYNFPVSGEYQLVARFQDGDKTLVEVSVPVAIAPSALEAPQAIPSILLLEWGGIFLLGAIIGIVGARMHKKEMPKAL
ncbi:MAG: hypothetical protein A3C84_00870 [Candidatus Ryanbacteria bacterium RIFCSPHIGHO2_02_FULL_48_12]|uniref:Uncharacterized protein n=1 Tax=Candidatus Ryanbacteria bacterium RIFCSPHIGHO2_01_FULL_48_27 TaxID=1802115 RepID=A0A1G2G4P7_9BACT|nr:MAG: hypothetical protein A2756_03450 [Candidatus Ryanbacteria bacterium RIFCSPHIGHO2_01_FULL_48_27]OGZ48328.1 MAG: hypothetical protein A3C84_00870 [Candidatus Ryanbacteria bacterium RIFCSPHIGHO2_02_FULL_48_12]